MNRISCMKARFLKHVFRTVNTQLAGIVHRGADYGLKPPVPEDTGILIPPTPLSGIKGTGRVEAARERPAIHDVHSGPHDRGGPSSRGQRCLPRRGRGWPAGFIFEDDTPRIAASSRVIKKNERWT